MSLLSLIASSDIFSIILFVLSSLIIILTISIFKLYIARLNSPKNHLENRQAQQQKQKRWKEIIRWYSIIQMCLNNNDPDHWLNKLQLLACFSVYMLFMGYELLILKVAKPIDANIFNEDMMAVCELLAGCASAIWPAIVLIMVDFLMRNKFLEGKFNPDVIVSKKDKRATKIRKCFYGTIIVVVIITCQLLYVENLLIGQIRYRPTLSKFRGITFAGLVLNKNVKILMMMPITLIYHQAIVILMSGITFTLEACKIIGPTNKVEIEAKVTTTMAAIIQQSHENIQNKCPAFIFRNDVDEGSSIHNDPIPLSTTNRRKNKEKADTSLVKRSRYSSYCSKNKKQDQEALERQQIAIGAFEIHVEDRNKENNYGKDHEAGEWFQDSIQYTKKKSKKIQPLQIQNHVSHDIHVICIRPQPHRNHTNNNYYFHDLGIVKQPTQPTPSKAQEKAIEPGRSQSKDPLYYRRGHKNRVRRSLPTVYESPVKKDHQFCLQDLNQLYSWKH